MASPARASSSPPAEKRQKLEQSSLTGFFQPKAPRNTPQQKKEKEEKCADQSPSTTTTTSTASALTTSPPECSSSETTNKETTPPTYAPIIPEPVKNTSSAAASWHVYRNACLYRLPKATTTTTTTTTTSRPRTKVAALDLDGTLLTWRIAGWPSRHEHYELWNHSVIPKLRDLHDTQDYQLILFSNQGAIRGAFGGKKATFVKSLVEWLAHVVDRPLYAVLSTDKKRGYHKPSPNMWTVAEECCCNQQQQQQQQQPFFFDVASSFFVGDSVEEEDDPQGGVDAKFARNVGEMRNAELAFYTPQEFFGPSHQDMRRRLQGVGDYDEPSKEVLDTRAALASGCLEGPLLLILCGAQGSGKSYFCRQLVGGDNVNDDGGSSSSWVHLSQDTINNGKPGKREHVEEQARRALTQERKSVVVDRMHLDETQRSHFVQVAVAAGVPAHAVVLAPPKQVVEQRVRERENHAGGVQGESGARLAVASSGKLVMPKYEEGFALVSVSRTTEGAARIAAMYRTVSSSSSSQTSISTSASSVNDGVSLSSEVTLPWISLGTMGLGRKETADVVSKAIELGFDSFDTAPTYKNEDKVGDALKNKNDKHRSKSFCIVKVPKRATSPVQVRQELRESLSKLQRTQADLLLLHWPSDVIAAGSLKEVWEEMEKCQTEGLVRAVGVCNFNVRALCMLLPHCTNVRPAVNQVERHPLLPQWDLVEFCAQQDIVLQAHSPLGQGSSELLEHAVVKDVASRRECSAAQVVLQWNLQQGVVVIPKCSSEAHMREVLALCDKNRRSALSVEDMKALNSVTERKRFVSPPFMFGMEPYCWGKRQ